MHSKNIDENIRPLPAIGSKVRMLRDTCLVKPYPLEGEIGTVTEHFPGYVYRDPDTGERIEIADAFGVEFDVPTGYGDSKGLCLHCDDPVGHTWELLTQSNG